MPTRTRTQLSCLRSVLSEPIFKVKATRCGKPAYLEAPERKRHEPTMAEWLEAKQR